MQEQKPLSNFIKTADEKTAEQLRRLGFYEISDNSPGYFVFVNCVCNFAKADVDMKKIQFTDKLCF
nr:MAG TPA: hypothetical protein [Caudoviricetes sp.]